MKTPFLLAVAAAALTFVSVAQAAPAGNWRCRAQGNIPVGLLTITGGAYKYQAVRNTAWAPKPGDASTGSGGFSAAGEKLAITSGPLRTKMGAKTGYYGYAGPDEYMDFYNDPNSAYLLRCHRF